MRIAYFSPLSPQPSGISDYSEELLPQLATHADIDLFVDGFRCNNPKVTTYFRFFDYRHASSALDRLNDYDAIVYHLGNDHRYHAGIYDVMCHHPGIVVFHDFALQDFFLALARDTGDVNIYLNEIAACHGEYGRATAERFLERGAVPPQFAQPLVFPLNCRLARSAEGIIVHSDWSRRRFEEFAPSVPVVRINHHITAHAAAQPITAKGPEAGKRVMIASFGMITPDKGIGRALRALAALRNECDFHYTIVGAPGHFPEVHELIQRYGLKDRVTITGYVPLTTFERYIAETDIAINLRERPVGATSGSLCRVMAAGVAAIVSNVGPFAELPGDAVVKIEHDSYADALLVAYLRRLITDSDLRRRIGANARRLMLAEHSIEESAARYAAFIREVIARRRRKQFLKCVADEISALGIRAKDDAFLRGVASEIAILAPVAAMATGNSAVEAYRNPAAAKSIIKRDGNAAPSLPSTSSQDRMPKVEGIDYKRAAIEYVDKLDAERRHYLLTKPFYNLANKPPKHAGEGMDAETFRHFCDFANMAVTLALPAGSRILDVGCGSGWLSEYFARLGYEVKGIDISPTLIEMSRRRVASVPYDVDHETTLRCTFAIHDIETGPLDEKFDAVICYDSLHHFEDERAVMRNIASMLDVGGVLFILEGERPAAGSSTEAELRAVMEQYRTLESPFDYSYLRELLDENGFAIVGDYVSVNGLFERELIEDDRLPLRTVPTNYHYFACKKVAEGVPASSIPDSRKPGRLSARIALRSKPNLRISSGEALEIDLEIENTGDTLWLAGSDARAGVVMPAVRIIDEEGTVVREVHGEPPLPHAVAPGEMIRLKIGCAAPQRSGVYALRVDLVDEQVCWFEESGSAPLTMRLEVV